MSSEYCVMCGVEIPEGRWVCPDCENKTLLGAPKEAPICKRCGRKLRSDEARIRGMGPICWEKAHSCDNTKPLFRKKEDK